MRATIVCFLTLILALPAVAEVTPTDMAVKVEAFYKTRTDIRARFTQRVKKPGRRRTLTKSGSVFFKRPGMMRWDYKRPEKVHYICDGKTLWSYQPADELATQLDVKSSELYHQSRYLFGQGKLTTDFKLSAGNALTTSGKNPATLYALVLKPKRSSRNFKQLTLFLTPETGEIRQTKLVDPYDNISHVTFKKVQYKALSATVFVFTPPDGVKVRNLSKKRAKK
jgi:outer membrane lipoprotein carrier protein